MPGGVDAQVDAAERPALLERLDDGDAVDAVGDAEMGVAGGDDVDQAWRQRPRQLEDLALLPAGRQVVGIGERVAAAAGMREHDHDRRACGAQARRLTLHDLLQRRHLQPHEVARIGAASVSRCVVTPSSPIRTPATVTIVDGWMLGGVHGAPAFVSRLAARNGKRRLARARLDVAGRVVAGVAGHRVRARRARSRTRDCRW